MTDTPPTAADELRTAAEALRTAVRSAERESPSPWYVDRDVVRCADGGIVADASSQPDRAGDLPYIAAMDPQVGAALAHWLEFTVAAHEQMNALFIDGIPPIRDDHPSLAVARAVLGATDRSGR